jgi:hypothetical protein
MVTKGFTQLISKSLYIFLVVIFCIGFCLSATPVQNARAAPQPGNPRAGSLNLIGSLDMGSSFEDKPGCVNASFRAFGSVTHGFEVNTASRGVVSQ